MIPSAAGQKRGRDVDDDGVLHGHPAFSKKVRPTLTESGEPQSWHHDSVISTPTTSSQKPKYDSDDQSSMVSEPGSPQDMGDSSGDDMDLDMGDSSFSQLSADRFPPPPPPGSNGINSPWGKRMQARNRVATPFGKPPQIRTGVRTSHVRERHPQENGSDHLEVPSPIDEDEVPTPPSAAEAAGSQLSMLSVNDMDIETAADLPSITIDPARNLPYVGNAGSDDRPSPGLEAVGSRAETGVRKQRQRSGAQSNGSVSPVRLTADREMSDLGGLSGATGKRGFSMGYRADCEKCRNRVPGHMNHFIL